MRLKNCKILFAAQYAAPYMGNFISSLTTLEDNLIKKYSAVCAYLLPKNVVTQVWFNEFADKHKVYLTDKNTQLISEEEADKILRNFKPDLVYTHFDGFDLPLYYASKRSKTEIRQVWHMHNAISFHRNPLKALYQLYCFWRHYGLPFITPIFNPVFRTKPCIIAVCKHELDFIRPFRLGSTLTKTIIPNGIDLRRIGRRQSGRHNPITFLAFGGRNISKRTDLLVKAATILFDKGLRIKVKIVGTKDTRVELEMICGKLPNYIEIINPQEDINSLFSTSDCFVSTSVYETFSYAIAEASVFGLPIIQSDIEGTAWNIHSPSAFVYQSENVLDLADKMEKIISTSEHEIDIRCKKASKINADTYSINSWSNRVIKFFESIP